MQSAAPIKQRKPEFAALAAIRAHWPEYAMEAFGLGAFMVSACVFAALLDHPSSPAHQAIDDPFLRRLLGGAAMGLTAVAIICSPWGRRSGAHLNPAFTLSFWALGKIDGADAVFYALAQFAGGAAGVWVAKLLIGTPLSHSAVNFAATVPGRGGAHTALVAEALISALLMGAVLYVSNSKRWTRFTPAVAGALIALYIAFEAPYSGMSMNPARTFASAAAANEWRAWWVYWIAPPAGMLLASLAYTAAAGRRRVFCAKLHHHNAERCIFRCHYGALSDR